MEILAIWRASSMLLQDRFWPTRAKVIFIKHSFHSCLEALDNEITVREPTVKRMKYKLMKCSPKREWDLMMATVLLTMQLHNASKIWSTPSPIAPPMKLTIISLRKYKFVNPHFQSINKTWIILSMTRHKFSNTLMWNSNTNILEPQCRQKVKRVWKVKHKAK